MINLQIETENKSKTAAKVDPAQTAAGVIHECEDSWADQRREYIKLKIAEDYNNK